MKILLHESVRAARLRAANEAELQDKPNTTSTHITVNIDDTCVRVIQNPTELVSPSLKLVWNTRVKLDMTPEVPLSLTAGLYDTSVTLLRNVSWAEIVYSMTFFFI